VGGDRFQAWIAEHIGVLHRIARAFATGSDQQDLLQELLVTVWRAAPSFRGESAPATFIFRVAHNRALTWRRGEARRRLRDEAYRRLHVEEEPGGDAALLDRLYAAIRQLAPLDRSLMLLALEGQSYAEIAALHGLSESNVGARLSRARQQLIHLTEQDHEL
jgi:RNA polymerase sigma factor (sigma-70 family)